ncbi:hypothetical protein [Nocardia salmonicida]|uniref:hypothetical protein n=1 Tax=Nocardia salmonicida TaxID=53431 RepID=UPI003438C8AE
MTELVAAKKLAESIIRFCQASLRMFCDYITSPYCQWVEECERRCGTHPTQVCHEWNTAAHLVDYEGRPVWRPMIREEVQQFFDFAEHRVELAMRRGRKGALAAYRNATVFKVIYAWGLRCGEASKIDFYRNAKAPERGRFGMSHVRYGKRSKGLPPKRRSVSTVMPWAFSATRDRGQIRRIPRRPCRRLLVALTQ